MTGQQVMTFGALDMEDTWWELDPEQRIHFDGMQQVGTLSVSLSFVFLILHSSHSLFFSLFFLLYSFSHCLCFSFLSLRLSYSFSHLFLSLFPIPLSLSLVLYSFSYCLSVSFLSFVSLSYCTHSLFFPHCRSTVTSGSSSTLSTSCCGGVGTSISSEISQRGAEDEIVRYILLLCFSEVVGFKELIVCFMQSLSKLRF